jgi:hypothetical protein
MAKMFVTITPTGNIKIQVEGIKGKKCVALSMALEESLGEVADRKFTSEYYQDESVKAQGYIKEKN